MLSAGQERRLFTGGATPSVPSGALKNVTLLVGINGTGKTSILRAIALGVLSPILGQSGYRPYYLVRVPKAGGRAVRAGWVSVESVLDKHETSGACRGPSTPNRITSRTGWRSCAETITTFCRTRRLDGKVRRDVSLRTSPRPTWLNAVEKRGPCRECRGDMRAARPIADEYYKDFSASFLLLGYAANRRVEEPSHSAIGRADKARGRRYLRVAGLFEEGVTLIPLASWLPQLRRTDRHKEITRLLNRTFPSGTRFTGRFHKDQQPLFTHEGVVLPFPALSDGYRAYIGLLGDILSHLSDCCPKGRRSTDLTGIVMVDDIDLHLHPQWQRVVVPRLRGHFRISSSSLRLTARSWLGQFMQRTSG